MPANPWTICLALLLSSILALPAFAAAPPLLLTHVAVIDGTGAPVQADMTIAIAGARIAAVYPSGSRALPQGARVQDLRGRYVMPGLIDAHVHLTGAEPDFAHYRRHLRALLLGGVTAVRDMAGDDRLLGYLAREANADALASPDIYYAALMAGPAFFAEDVRAQEASAGERPGSAPWMQAISATTDIPLAVAEAKGTGATALKLYADLPAGLVRQLAAEAHRQGLRVWTHATIFPATPADAVAAGADTISHSPYLVWAGASRVPDDYRVRAMGDFAHIRPDAPPILALLQAMKRRGTILDATLLPFQQEAEHDPAKVGAGIMPWSYAVTRLAHAQGVWVDAGSDSSGLPDASHGPNLRALPEVHAEMALLVEHAGFTPLEAIRAATEVGAAAMGQSARRGTIAVGKLADLVVLGADPTRDIRNTGSIVLVIKNGRIHRKDAPRGLPRAPEEGVNQPAAGTAAYPSVAPGRTASLARS
ncbi:MAG: amidohydrolase family protein [Pseudomonadota bacterium]|nr:amidohydrolase family protein [Xanthomonadaceae bacterium]MDE3210217.1 amidohydrolase family protein [Pseudomonadota bacterium]